MPQEYKEIVSFSHHQPSSHELAKFLLSEPDQKVVIDGLGTDILFKELALGSKKDGEPVFVIEADKEDRS
jgi:hypothetical protein